MDDTMFDDRLGGRGTYAWCGRNVEGYIGRKDGASEYDFQEILHFASDTFYIHPKHPSFLHPTTMSIFHLLTILSFLLSPSSSFSPHFGISRIGKTSSLTHTITSHNLRPSSTALSAYTWDDMSIEADEEAGWYIVQCIAGERFLGM